MQVIDAAGNGNGCGTEVGLIRRIRNFDRRRDGVDRNGHRFYLLNGCVLGSGNAYPYPVFAIGKNTGPSGGAVPKV
jgi:hypothetical protein